MDTQSRAQRNPCSAVARSPELIELTARSNCCTASGGSTSSTGTADAASVAACSCFASESVGAEPQPDSNKAEQRATLSHAPPDSVRPASPACYCDPSERCYGNVCT